MTKYKSSEVKKITLIIRQCSIRQCSLDNVVYIVSGCLLEHSWGLFWLSKARVVHSSPRSINSLAQEAV